MVLEEKCVLGGKRKIKPRIIIIKKKIYTNQSLDLQRWWSWVFTPEITTELEGGPWAELCQRQSLPQPQPHFQLVVSRHVFIFTKCQKYVWLCKCRHSHGVNKGSGAEAAQIKNCGDTQRPIHALYYHHLSVLTEPKFCIFT